MPSEPGYPLRLYLLGLYSLCMAHHAVGAGRRLGMETTYLLLTTYYPLSLTMPSEPGVVFSLKMRMALFIRARSIALRTWVRGER